MALRERFRGMSVAECMAHQAAERPERTLVISGDRRLTYREVERDAHALAAALHQLGIERGDRIALNLPNWPEFILAAFAAAKLGAIIVPLNPRYTSPELQYMLRHSEAVAVVTAEHFDGVDYLARFEGFLASLPELQYVISVGEEDLWYDDRVYQFEDLVSSGEGRQFPATALDPQIDVFAIVYTSGTMGKPKGVELTHTNLLATAAAAGDAIDLRADDVVAGITTLFNVFGLGPGVLASVMAGATVVLHPEQDAPDTLQMMEREQVTVHHGVPANFIMELQELASGAQAPRSLRTGIVAGAPISEELIVRIRRELVPQIQVGYGMTETGSTIAMTRPDDPRGKQISTVGQLLDGFDVRVLDVDGTPLPVESVGELAVKGPGVMRGYYRQPAETAHAFTEDGYFRTGDLGMIDEEGYLHLLGRRKEMIIRGGFNVYPGKWKTDCMRTRRCWTLRWWGSRTKCWARSRAPASSRWKAPS